MSKPTNGCLQAAMRILKYISSTSDVGILYEPQVDFNLKGFTDTDHAGDVDRISRYAYNIFLGSHQILWGSNSLKEMTLSSCESELLGSGYLGIELLYLKKVQGELIMCRPLQVMDKLLTPRLYMDNRSAVALLRSKGYKSGTRHIEYLVMRRKLQAGLEKVSRVYLSANG
jgi:hypothetical protein